MSRARNLKPGFFTNGDLLECEPLARLLFAGLWCEADRRGIVEDRPKTIKIKVLPGDNCDIDQLLNQLESKGFIHRYERDGVRCIHVTKFGKHQNPHVKEQPNTLPAPDQHGAGPVLVSDETDDNTGSEPDEHCSSPAESLSLESGSLIPDPGGEHDAPARAAAPELRLLPRPTGAPPIDETADVQAKRQTVFNAYAEGVGIKRDSMEWMKRWNLSWGDLSPAVVNAITPERMLEIARFVSMRRKAVGLLHVPAIDQVILAESEFDAWEEAGRPETWSTRPNDKRDSRTPAGGLDIAKYRELSAGRSGGK